MAVSASGLFDDIIAAFPAEWNWQDWSSLGGGLPSPPPNKVWLEAMCSGFVNMWLAGIMSPGAGPGPVGSYPHAHTLTTLVAATMTATLPAYSADALMVANAMANGTVSHLLANTVMDTQDGSSPHTHAFTSFGAASGLSSTIEGLVTFTSISPAFQAYLDGFAAGLIGHLEANADMSPSALAAHVHALL